MPSTPSVQSSPPSTATVPSIPSSTATLQSSPPSTPTVQSSSPSTATVQPIHPTTTKNVHRNTVWSAEADNLLANDTPIFSGNSKTNIHSKNKTLYSYFIEIFTDEMFEHIRTDNTVCS